MNRNETMNRTLEIRGATDKEVNKFLTILNGLENTEVEATKYKLLINARFPYFPQNTLGLRFLRMKY